MKTLTTLASFIEASHLNPSLIRAVVRQLGGWESFCQSAPDIAQHGIDGGFCGFTYNVDTEAFAKRHHKLIASLASEQAAEFGTGIFEMIRGFGCFRNWPDNEKPSDEEIGIALYAGRDADGTSGMLNALAWYAGEEVCRSYVDITEQD